MAALDDRLDLAVPGHGVALLEASGAARGAQLGSLHLIKAPEVLEVVVQLVAPPVTREGVAIEEKHDRPDVDVFEARAEQQRQIDAGAVASGQNFARGAQALRRVIGQRICVRRRRVDVEQLPFKQERTPDRAHLIVD